MSKESLEWLNANTLIGFTDKRGTAWHYRASAQGAEPNHYPGAIPAADVKRRLFGWEPVQGTVETTFDPGQGLVRITDATRKTVIRPDTGEVLGVFKSGFRIHEYKQWLVTNVESILDDELSIGSAGLLKGGALAWVQVEVPETCTTADGVAFRPFLSAATSLDGSLASTYQTGAQLIVCDNTLSAALADNAALRLRIKHSSKSLGRISQVREALGIIHHVTDAFEAQVAALCGATVTDAQWAEFVDAHVPLPDKPGRGRTIAERKRAELDKLWCRDPRVAPWRGTAFGVVQAVNTHVHHIQTVRGAHRAERNMHRVITGGIDELDQATVGALSRITGAQLLTTA